MRTTLITVRLQMRTSGGVPSGKLPDNAMTLRTDPHGTPHLPGTTIAGSLRAHCRRYEALSGAFGNEPPHEANESHTDERQASQLQVLGTVYRPIGDPHVRTRTVDPQPGAADNRMLHSVEQLPPGTEFDVILRWDEPKDGALKTFFEALASWHPRIGRGISHGSGHCHITAWASKDYDLATEEGLLAWIQNTDLDSYPTPYEQPGTQETPRYALALEYEIVDGIHIGNGEYTKDHNSDGTADEPTENTDSASTVERTKADNNVDIARVLREQHGDTAHVVIPGSSLKGILRARAEYICRVIGADACASRACGQCRPCRLFGYTTRESARRSAIAVHDAIISEAHCENRQHVAPDRFTGGAAPRLLYTDEVIVAGHFTLRVELLETIQDAEQALLEAVAADFNEGLVGIGARTTSGQGTVRLTTNNPNQPDTANLAALLHEEIPA